MNWDEGLVVFFRRIVIAAGDFNCSKEAIDSAKILDDPVMLIFLCIYNLHYSHSFSLHSPLLS